MLVQTPGYSQRAKVRYPYLALVSPVSKEIYIFDLSQRGLDSTIDATAHFSIARSFYDDVVYELAVRSFVFPLNCLTFSLTMAIPCSVVSISTSAWCFSLESGTSRSLTVKVDLELPC
jgi:hypothetical protein